MHYKGTDLKTSENLAKIALKLNETFYDAFKPDSRFVWCILCLMQVLMDHVIMC